MAILLEVKAIIRPANKEDIFPSDIFKPFYSDGIKENVTIFYRSRQTGVFSGPHKTIRSSCPLYDAKEYYMLLNYDSIGVPAPLPTIINQEFVFDFVLRQATIDDLQYNPRHLRYNSMYYTYAQKVLLGPFYIDRSTTLFYIENLVARNQIFVPHYRQHFLNKQLQKTG